MRVFKKILSSDPFFDYEICEFHEKPEKGVLDRFHFIYEVTDFLMRFMHDFDDRSTLKSLLADINCLNNMTHMDDQDGVQKIANEIFIGRLFVVKHAKDRLYGDWNINPVSNKTAEPVQTEPISGPADAWVEIKIVDAEENPVSWVKYELVLPGGKIENGMTGSDGMIRYLDINKGQCQFSLSDLDDPTWEKV